MKSCLLTLTDAPNGRTKVQLGFHDFNRLRWAVAALRHNAKLQASIASKGHAQAHLVDANVLMTDTARVSVPGQAHIVLWDGLNSLVELRMRRPDLITRDDLRYFYVGHFDDIDTAFPAGSEPLFGSTTLAHFSAQSSNSVQVPWMVEMATQVRRKARPWANRFQQAKKHHQLLASPQLVFCGVVRPTSLVLDDMYRGVALDTLRHQMQDINALDWRTSPTRTRALITLTAARLQQALGHIQTHADLAFLFGMHNLLHRIGTLTCLSAMKTPLFVNEFDVQTHFDPYDAQAYQNNLFIDFGSTRGIDEVYPRTLDMLTTGKPCLPLRVLGPGQSLRTTLAHQGPEALWARCEVDAQHATQALLQLTTDISRLPT
jgi:hypothetical protein